MENTSLNGQRRYPVPWQKTKTVANVLVCKFGTCCGVSGELHSHEGISHRKKASSFEFEFTWSDESFRELSFRKNLEGDTGSVESYLEFGVKGPSLLIMVIDC